MKIFKGIVQMCILMIALMMRILAMIRNEVAFKNQEKIGTAIFKYRIHMISNGFYNFVVSYDDMEPYELTMLRVWDFGYSNILPPDKYEVIKPYIE